MVFVRGLVLADLLHQALVLLEQALMFTALGLELFLPAFADGGFFAGGTIATREPADDDTDDKRANDNPDVSDSYLRHVDGPYEARAKPLAARVKTTGRG